MNLYLERWALRTDWFGSYWIAPYADKCIGSIDLRSLPQMGKIGGTPEGWGLFAYSSPVNLTNSLGDLTKTLTTNQRQTIKKALVTPDSLPNVSIKDLIYWLLKTQGDATGQLRWKPLRAGIDGKDRIFLGNQIYGEPLPKYRSGTFTDSFTRADSNSLGSDWTELEAAATDIHIDSNHVHALGNSVTAYSRGYMTAALDNNQYAQVNALWEQADRGWCGVIGRQGAGNNFYLFIGYVATDEIKLFKCVNGSFTQLGSTLSQVMAGSTQYLMKISCDGTTITTYWAGTQKHQQTDTALASGVGGFILGNDTTSSSQFDDFEAGDLAAGPSGTVYLVAATGRRTRLADTNTPVKVDPYTGRRGTSSAFSKYLVKKADGRYTAE